MFQKKGQNLRSVKSSSSASRSESSTVTPLDGSDSSGKALFQINGRSLSLSLNTAGSPAITAITRESFTETPRDARDSSGTDSEDSSAKRGSESSFASFSR